MTIHYWYACIKQKCLEEMLDRVGSYTECMLLAQCVPCRKGEAQGPIPGPKFCCKVEPHKDMQALEMYNI